MNFVKSSGESSCKGQEDGDASTGSERPLKKARFAWQVKGKYHLKNENEEFNKNVKEPGTAPSTSKLPSSQSSPASFAQNEMENYLLDQEYNPLESVVDSNNSLLTPKTNISKESTQYPRYLSSFERNLSNNSMFNNSCNSVKTVPKADTAEDICIAQWQAKQIVKCCLDNTLNRVLESWTTDPEANSRFIAQDFAEFVNHLPEDNSVENEGILMAISAHGLQNASSSSGNYSSNIENYSTSNALTLDIPLPLPSLSPIVSDEESQQADDQLETKMPSKIHDWQCENQNANDATSFAYSPPQSPYIYYDDIQQSSNTDSLDIDSHFDFMNAAVMYAIKSKGLTASGTEYG